jgi:hypothetical protein
VLGAAIGLAKFLGHAQEYSERALGGLGRALVAAAGQLLREAQHELGLLEGDADVFENFGTDGGLLLQNAQQDVLGAHVARTHLGGNLFGILKAALGIFGEPIEL